MSRLRFLLELVRGALIVVLLFLGLIFSRFYKFNLFLILCIIQFPCRVFLLSFCFGILRMTQRESVDLVIDRFLLAA